MSICSVCHGGCCRRFNINLTGYEILMFSKALDLDFLDFTSVYNVNPEDEERLSKSVALFKFSDYGDEYQRFCLKMVKSSIYPDSVKCMFLQEWDTKILDISDKFNGVVARCGIYSIRPYECAIYPSSFDTSGLVGLTGDPNAFIDKSDNPAYHLCPRSINAEDFADYSGNILNSLVLQKYEMDYFKSLANIWNKKQAPLSEFYDFLVQSYKNRVLFCKKEEAYFVK